MMNISKKTARTLRSACTLIILLLFSQSINAQVAVAPMTLLRAQFTNSVGIPLASGCVNFFATGTSTPQAIYADSGGVNQLPNPLTLDAAGEASVWMTNTGYDIAVYTGVFGTPCSVSLGSQLWKEINKNPFSIINGGSNYIIANSASDPAGSPGELAYRTDIPCFRGFTTIWDCFVTLTSVQSLSNKTLTTPIINGQTTGTGVQGAGTKLLSSSTISGNSVSLCTDAGGTGTATTTGCGGGAVVSVSTSAATNFGINLGAQTIIGSASNTGVYNIGYSAIVSTVGVGCSAANNSVTITVAWTAPGGTAETAQTTLVSFVGNGVLDSGSLGVVGFLPFIVKAGTAITYTTTSVLNATGCSPIPQYTVYVKAFS